MDNPFISHPNSYTTTYLLGRPLQTGDIGYGQEPWETPSIAPQAAALRAIAAPSGVATYNNPSGIGSSIGSYYSGALANDPRLPAINRNISGQIAPDVRNMLAQSAAERGIGIGSYGGGNDQSSLLRALGLTSMDLTNKGVGQYGEAYSQVPALNPTSLFINPTDQAQMALNQQLQSQRIASEQMMASQSINAAAGRQAGQLAASSQDSAAQRAQEQAQFDQKRKDALSALSSSNSRLQGIIDRNSGGGTGGRSATSVTSPFPYGGGAQSDFAGDINNLWWQPSDYGSGYTGPSANPVDRSYDSPWQSNLENAYYSGADSYSYDYGAAPSAYDFGNMEDAYYSGADSYSYDY